MKKFLLTLFLFWILGIGIVEARIPIAYSIGQPTFLVGAEEIVYNWSEDNCPSVGCDAPDMPARAFIDADGNLTLLATSGDANIRKIGTNFDNLVHDCDNPIFDSPEEEEPSQYSDKYWPSTPWINQSTNIVHMVFHQEYWAMRHRNISNCTLDDDVAWIECSWWSIVSATSTNGGANYTIDASPPEHLIATVPYTYVPDWGSAVGYGHQSNILLGDDGYYYVYFQSMSNYQEQKAGFSIMRTADISDHTSWRMWNGTDFSVESVNPYTESGTFDPSEKVARPILTGIKGLKTAIEMEESGKYILIADDEKNFTDPETGEIADESVAYFHLSDDLFHFGPEIPFKIDRDDSSWAAERGASSYYSIIDHASGSPNFETVSVNGEPHLYFMSREADASNCERDLWRSPLQFITWNDLQAALNPIGFLYYGIGARNRPAIGNTLIEVIGNKVNGLDFFSDLQSGGIQYDYVEGTNRFGIRGMIARTAYLQPKVGFTAWSFTSLGNYQNFLSTGSTSGGIAIIPSMFNNPLSLNNRYYGFRADNVPPTHDVPTITSVTRESGDPVTCASVNADDYDEDDINTVTTFQVKRAGETEFTPFEEVVISFDIDTVLPRLVDFEKAPYSSILDYAGFNNNIIKHFFAMPTYTPSGQVGGAYVFSGDEVILIDNKEGLELRSGEDFSIEFWVQTTQGGGIFDFNELDEDSTFSYTVGVSNGRAAFALDYGDSPVVTITNTNVNDGAFHHVAFVADTQANEIRAYVDGNPAGSTEWYEHTGQVIEHKIKDIIPGLGLSLDSRYDLGYFTGVIDELRMYHHALPQDMITAHADGNYSFVSGDFVEGLDTWRCEVTLNDGSLVSPSEQSGGLGISSGDSCGDGVLDTPDEECDGSDFGGSGTCSDYDIMYDSGTLTCSESCEIEVDNCVLGLIPELTLLTPDQFYNNVTTNMTITGLNFTEDYTLFLDDVGADYNPLPSDTHNHTVLTIMNGTPAGTYSVHIQNTNGFESNKLTFEVLVSSTGEDCNDQDGDGYEDALCGGSDCDDSDGDINPGATEVCDDDIDQDCSGADAVCTSDECTSGNTRYCDTGLLGRCSLGEEECVSGEWSGTCDQTVFPNTEVCDGYDNDCDGREDEGGVCVCSEDEEQACGSNIGICEQGEKTCTNNQWSGCTGGVEAKAHDICGNSLDDDCDTEVDEDCDFFSVTCFNGVMDENEEGVDCGGRCPRECLGLGNLYIFIIGVIILLAALILILNMNSKMIR